MKLLSLVSAEIFSPDNITEEFKYRVSIVLPCQVPVVIVPKLEIKVLPVQVDKAVFSTLPSPSDVRAVAPDSATQLVPLPTKKFPSAKDKPAISAKPESNACTSVPITKPKLERAVDELAKSERLLVESKSPQPGILSQAKIVQEFQDLIIQNYL